MAERASEARRATISDIARLAGVSKGAVSYALNGRPGVSDDTRDRIRAIADELGWYPNRAARALSAARADACGLLLARPAKTLALEPFFMEFIAGVESELSSRSIALTIQLVDERPGRDRRLPPLVGRAPRRRGADGRPPRRRPAGRRPRVDRPAGRRGRRPGRRGCAPRRLARRGVGGRSRPCATWSRSATSASRRSAAWGSSSTPSSGRTPSGRRRRARRRGDMVSTDYSPESGARATRKLLASPRPPTAIIFDSDLLAVTGLGVAQPDGLLGPRRRVDRGLGRLAHQPGRPPAADAQSPATSRRTASPPRSTCSRSSRAGRAATWRHRAAS